MSTATAPLLERITPAAAHDVPEVVRAAHDQRRPLRIAGAGQWLAAGHPVPATHVLDLSRCSGIVEYVPGDLTLTALAGTPLADIAAATARHGQWLPLDAFGRDGTLGATLATASSGPLGGSIGLPRDLTVGVTFVTGEGELVHGGGRVVKNVAGFDLVRLVIGAWGTLGVVTQATVRLRARPEVDETVALALPAERDALGTLLSSVRNAPVEPLAAELLTAACAARIGLASRDVMLIRLAGNATGVHHQRAAIARLGAVEDVAPAMWRQLQESDSRDAGIVRVSRRPSELARLWNTTRGMTGIDAHASLARGIVRLRLTSETAPVLQAFDQGDRCITELHRPWLTPWSAGVAANPGLARRLRDAFDPRRILNPGILGEDG